MDQIQAGMSLNGDWDELEMEGLGRPGRLGGLEEYRRVYLEDLDGQGGYLDGQGGYFGNLYGVYMVYPPY